MCIYHYACFELHVYPIQVAQIGTEEYVVSDSPGTYHSFGRMVSVSWYRTVCSAHSFGNAIPGRCYCSTASTKWIDIYDATLRFEGGWFQVRLDLFLSTIDSERCVTRQAAQQDAASTHGCSLGSSYEQLRKQYSLRPNDYRQNHRSRGFQHAAQHDLPYTSQFTQRHTPEQFSAIQSTTSSVVVFTASFVQVVPLMCRPDQRLGHSRAK